MYSKNMKKLYSVILFITLTIALLGCDEIKKVFDNAKTYSEKATLTKPAVSSYRVSVGTVVTFPKVPGYTYALKKATSGVTLSNVPGKPTKKQVSSTKVASGVVIVATLDGISIDSEPIEFVLLYVANKKELQAEIKRAIKAHGNEVDLNYIDTSQITDMSELFYKNATFNGNISKWDTSSVTSMIAMFNSATNFNQPLNSWDVSSVTEMSLMFYNASSFNQPLDRWDVSSVEDMYAMFRGATAMQEDYPSWIR